MKPFVAYEDGDNFRIVVTFAPKIEVTSEDLAYIDDPIDGEIPDRYLRSFILERYTGRDALGNKTWEKIEPPNDKFIRELINNLTERALDDVGFEPRLV